MSKFHFETVNNYMVEHGEYVGCGTGGAEDTLDKAIDAAAEEMLIVPGYDGRGDKIVTIVETDNQENAHTFCWPHEWNDLATAALRSNMRCNMAQ